MTAPKGVSPASFLRELDAANPDLLREMVKAFADALMSAEADVVCGAPYGQRSDERVNSRNGYRSPEWDTRAGTVELAVPKLRHGSYFPTGCCRITAPGHEPTRNFASNLAAKSLVFRTARYDRVIGLAWPRAKHGATPGKR